MAFRILCTLVFFALSACASGSSGSDPAPGPEVDAVTAPEDTADTPDDDDPVEPPDNDDPEEDPESNDFPTDDDFAAAALDASWIEYDPHNAVSPRVDTDELVLRLESRALWFNDSEGFALYKQANGNFKMTTRLRVFKTSEPSEAPDGYVELAGLMLRDPASDGAGAENFVFIVLGSDDGLDTSGTPELAIETKNTVDSVSEYINPAWASASAELRICRVEDDVSLYHRELGAASWLPTPTSLSPTEFGYSHQLPESVQAGVVIYSASDAPDISAAIEYVHFDPVATTADCAND